MRCLTVRKAIGVNFEGISIIIPDAEAITIFFFITGNNGKKTAKIYPVAAIDFSKFSEHYYFIIKFASAINYIF